MDANPRRFGNMLVFGRSAGAAPIMQGGVGGTIYSGAKRHGFYSVSAEELAAEDDYYDEQMHPEKKRRLSPDQVQLLEQSFEAENKLEPERKCELAKKLGLQPRQIAIWFQNRRARWKNKQLERDFDILKSAYDALVADHDMLLADNQRLQAEVLQLTERLGAKNSECNQTASPPHPADWSIPVADATDAATSIAGPPVLEDRLSSGSGQSAVADEGGSLAAFATSNSCFNDPEDGGSYNGASGGLLYSEDDDGSDDGGAYLSGMFIGTHFAGSDGHHVGEVGENLNIVGWWDWN